MGRRLRLLLMSCALTLGLPGIVCAQLSSTAMPSLGPLMGTTQPAPAADPTISINDTFVSFIDSAVPRTVIGLRFDGTYDNRQPTRATYLFPKGGTPGSVGFPLPETRVDAQAITTIREFLLTLLFSVV